MEKAELPHVTLQPVSPPTSWRTRSFILKAALLVCLLWLFTTTDYHTTSREWSPIIQDELLQTEALRELVEGQKPAQQSSIDVMTSFSWDEAEALPYLIYSPCYTEAEDGPFQCARLQLPMDYWNGTTNATIGLAVIKKPAVVSVTDER
jgi:hypothetical protein